MINFILSISVEWWAIIASIILGIFNIWQTYYKDKKTENKEMDRRLFKNIEGLMSYNDANDLFVHLNSKSFFSDSKNKIAGVINILEDPNNKFNNKNIESSKMEMFDALQSLRMFLVEHFFFVMDDMYSLYPELKHSKDPKEQELYKKRAEELKLISLQTEKVISDFFKSCGKIYI